MNIEALKKARDCLAESKTYDQSNWTHPCGSPACVAGHIVAANGHEITKIPWGRVDVRCYVIMGGDARPIDVAAAVIAGLEIGQAGQMFSGNPYVTSCAEVQTPVTKEEALSMLDHAIEHDEVKWPERA